MAKYVGETIRISATATDYDGDTELGESDVDTVQITIYDAAGAPVVSAAPMSWDSTHSSWAYDWETGSTDAGTYRVKVRIATGVTENWEYGRVQLKANPV